MLKEFLQADRKAKLLSKIIVGMQVWDKVCSFCWALPVSHTFQAALRVCFACNQLRSSG